MNLITLHSLLGYYINTIIGSFSFLFGIKFCAFLLKAYFLAKLISIVIKSKQFPRPLLFLISALISTMTTDFAWILKLSTNLFFPNIDNRVCVFFFRIAWGLTAVYYQSITLLLESLLTKNYKSSFRQKVYFVISNIFFVAFIGLAFFQFNNTGPNRPELSFQVFSLLGFTNLNYNICELLVIYTQAILVLSIVLSSFRLSKLDLPKILKRQLYTLIAFIIAPQLFFDFLQVYPLNIVANYLTSNRFTIISISTTLITYSIYYCAKKIMNLRFLNLHSHVESSTQFNFINNFKDVLEQLSYATTTQEAAYITKTMFKNALSIPIEKTNLYIRNLNSKTQISNNFESNITLIVEQLLSSLSEETYSYIKRSQILTYDEIEFSNFYENNIARNEILSFLNQINAEIFIPIYNKQTIIAYIIVEKNARKELYSKIERDEIIVFASYLGNVLNLLQNRNLDLLIRQEKDMKEELYQKHQEINQYKESIRSFLKSNQHKKIGILFYKNRKFIFGNQDAKEIINININAQEGHQLARDLKKIVKHVEEYKVAQNIFSKDPQGNRLVLSALPNLEQNNIIVLVHYPDISDIIKQQIDMLKDPSRWDYLLYLETTKSGQLINQLIPGSGEYLLNFKIDLLKIALSKKAILLNMPEEDLIPTIEIIHHISLRESLHILKLQGPSHNIDLAVKLFGINSLFGISEDKPLLQKLNGNGTLFIQNIHLMDIETQKYLAEFIKFGFYRIFKSDQKLQSDVRVICSTNQNLQALVQEGKFSQELYSQLNTTLSLPSLLTLSEDELQDLAQGFSEQAIQTDTFKNLLELTDKERSKLISRRPASLQDFKNKVQQILVEKTKKNHIDQETQFDPAYNITDPKLIEAARLGKHALKDPQIMALLWNKFKNQNKIATFLGVNRSSVHRRCKEYNLE